jgi:hypothetical protein
MRNPNKILVLNDGETYSGLDGCRILVLTDEDLDNLELGKITVSETSPITTIKLSD